MQSKLSKQKNRKNYVYKYDCLDKDGFIELCEKVNRYGARFEKIQIYFEDGSSENVNVLQKNLQIIYLQKAISDAYEYSEGGIEKAIFTLYRASNKSRGFVEFTKHKGNKDELHQLYLKEHQIDGEIEEDFEELKLMNLASALLELDYSIACDYCTKERCPSKNYMKQCSDCAVDYFSGVLKNKKAENGYI